ncbi:DsbA family oxidoreductase [Robertkochia marina]|uniref:DsbA family oxidoreductase n=1 Tax=Robertkochia marina TaxID=1227945 RepID=A0A4S3M481_9FLAO|nr:DsbA family oxidoreductase [Robertkochia marina]THD69700.1 DsbA family oxidoreductase [Robertkochia marina]TRZ47055.1 DsbA family oxidoreductase [Robertkochia marina]
MKIEIWSDVACPWCYIGKKRFEKALSQFPHSEHVEVEWKSFLLNPNQKTDTDASLVDYLAREKGLSAEQVKQMMMQVTKAGAGEGIDFDFEKVVVANTVRAHALLQMAKNKGLGDEVKKRLLLAYFSENINVDDPDQLIRIGEEAGLDAGEIKKYLSTDEPFKKVEFDLKEAAALGIRGVPYFVIDRKYGISGAQESHLFTEALEKAFSEWKEQQE